MRSLGLMPSRPKPSTFPYIHSELQETSASPSLVTTMTKTENFTILPTRPLIHVDLATPTTSKEFVKDNEAEKTVPLLAQPQCGSQERYYFSSVVTSTCVTTSQQSYGGDAKLAADVMALSRVTPPISNAALPDNAISSKIVAATTTIISTSIASRPTSSIISISPNPSIVTASVERNLGDTMPGSVSIFKTSSGPNQHTNTPHPRSPEQALTKDKSRGILSPVSECTMSYYLDKASMLTARSQQFLQANSRRSINNYETTGNAHDQSQAQPAPSLQLYLQERAVLQAARANKIVDGKDEKPPDNVVAPNNSYQRQTLNRERSVSNNLEATCQAIMAQSNSTMQVSQGPSVIVLDKKSSINTNSPVVTSAPPSIITVAPLDSLQKPRETAHNLIKVNSPISSSSVGRNVPDNTYAPRNVTMNVNDMPSITSSSIVHHHPQLPQNVQLAANAANIAASGASFNNSYPTVLSSSKSHLPNGTQNQTGVQKNFKSNQDQNSNIQVQSNTDSSSPAKRIKLEGYHNSQPNTPTKLNENSGSHDATRAHETSMNSPTAGTDGNSTNNSDNGVIEIMSTNEEGKPKCGFCNKLFQKQSQLRLHVNIHYFERPFRCEACAVSFRTKGHLQKHKRSTGHYNKVNINATFGTPSNSNPRPFKCTDCKVAFRIHGHLAKHLRSKMHIMKLECSGKLPIGMFAEMERLGTNLAEIDTKDCDKSLESLQEMAVKLYNNDPSKLTPPEDVQNVQANHSDVSDNEEGNEIEVKEEPMDVQQPGLVGKSSDYHNSLPSVSSHIPIQQRQAHENPKKLISHDTKRHGLLPSEHYPPHHLTNTPKRAPTSHGNQQLNTQADYIPANHLSQSVSLVPPPNQQIGPRQSNNMPLAQIISPNVSAAPMPPHARMRHPQPVSANSSIHISSQPPTLNTNVAPIQPSDQPRSASVSSSHLSQDDASTTDSEPVSECIFS